MSTKKLFLLVFSLLLLPSALLAKPKTKLFDNNPDEVYLAALRTARSKHVVTFTDDKNHMLTFETGLSALSYGFVANASVEAEGSKSKLIVNVQHKNDGKNSSFSFGAGDRMADKFFQQVEEELANKSTQKTSDKPDAAHVEVPQGTAAAPSQSTTTTQQGAISVSSTPDGADVSVDGAFVGNAPATLKLSPGKHTISVSQTGFSTWTKEISVMAGSDVKLNAVLSK